MTSHYQQSQKPTAWQTFKRNDVAHKDLPTIKPREANHSARNEKSSSSRSIMRIYIAGVPYSRLYKTRDLLRTKISGFQLDWIQNLSWIDRKIVEMSIHESRFLTIRKLFEKHKSSEYYLLPNFDPLDSNSFHWEKDILPEDQEAILRQNLAKRLARSAVTTSRDSTSNELRDYAHNRGIGRSFDTLLEQSNTSNENFPGLSISLI